TSVVAPAGQTTQLSTNAQGLLTQVTDPAGDTTAMAYAGDLLTRFIDPNGGVHSMEYDTQGRLTRDTNPVGGSLTLQRTDRHDGYDVTTTNALGDTTHYALTMLPSGDIQRTTTQPNGATTVELDSSAGTTQTTDASGVVTTTRYGPDPRFGMQAPVPS